MVKNICIIKIFQRTFLLDKAIILKKATGV